MPENDQQEFGPPRPRPSYTGEKTLSEWRIEQIEFRLERELKDLRIHVDRTLQETRKVLDDEIRDMREHNDKRFGKIENFIIAALLFIATPVIGAMVAIVLKNPPSL